MNLKRLATFGLVLVGCIAVAIITHNVTKQGSSAPDYKTVLPKEKSISELGGWNRVSPPNSKPVFAYTDTIDGIPISVSQQPLPPSSEGTADQQVAEIAQKFNATEKVDAKDITLYVGTSSKGPQSVIFTKNKVLILIKSDKKIENKSWASYAESLG